LAPDAIQPRRRLDRSAKRGAERPSLHDKRLIVERRSLHSALRASVETTEIAYAIALHFAEEAPAALVADFRVGRGDKSR